ncbi:MAG: hypothetical protein LBK76_08895 [Verrucomicrobiales bacterium]|jgi:hypothetical protein|nr:hypothetical protein [Verrucomicrobiales bacterium]
MKTSKQIGKWLAMGTLLLASGTGALAATWTGDGADNDWDTPGNWQDNTVPAANDPINFGNLTPEVATVSVDNNHTGLLVGQITFSDTTAYTIGGVAITSTNSSNVITNNSSVRQTISADFYSGWSASGRTINGGEAGVAFVSYVNSSAGDWGHIVSGNISFDKFYISTPDTKGSKGAGYALAYYGNNSTTTVNEIHSTTPGPDGEQGYGFNLTGNQTFIITGTTYFEGSMNIGAGVTVVLQGAADVNSIRYFEASGNTAALINNADMVNTKYAWVTGTLGGTGQFSIRGTRLHRASTEFHLAPGDINSVGKLGFVGGAAEGWNSAGSVVTYDWNYNHDLTAAAGVGFDQIYVEGTLNFGADTQYVLNLVGLDGASLDDFTALESGVWDIITATGGISNFDTSRWTYDDTLFDLALSGDATSLQLLLIPEPTVSALLLGGSLLLSALAALRRQRSARSRG